jgi:DNA adenine methylase
MRKHPETQAAGPNKPVLKRVEGKSRILHHILPRLPRGTRLVEPFVSGGSVFLRSEYDGYLLADTNSHLMDLYNEVETRPLEFIECAQGLFNETYRSRERYLEVRAAFNRSEGDALTRAAQFFYLNKHGFNGLCRYNAGGHFNVPYGSAARPVRLPVDDILRFADKAVRAVFVNDDFLEIMSMAEQGDVVYCDPPYLDRDSGRSFTGYCPGGFSMARQVELAALARELAARGVPVAISNHDCAIARELCEGAELYTFEARRSISANGSKRQPVNELLAVFS